MNVEMDEDVKAVVEFMQRNIAASRLVVVSDSIKSLAQILWGHFDREEIKALRVVPDPIAGNGQQTQSGASEYAPD
jgi:hypothetical protein